MELKVLGSGCKYCIALEENAKIAVKKLGVEASVEKVTDIQEIMSFGVMSTPALVIDGVVKSAGRVLKPEDIEELIKEKD